VKSTLHAVGPDVLGPNDVSVAHCRYGGEAPGPVYGAYGDACDLARMFAAAPDLFGALMDLFDRVEETCEQGVLLGSGDFYEEREAARAAIAKARRTS
jgi:hypothetical protein